MSTAPRDCLPSSEGSSPAEAHACADATGHADAPTVSLRGVSVVYDGATVLGPLDWDIAPHERWIVLGPNGSGKTSLVKVLSLYRFPTTGMVEVLGERWGAVDVREHRRRIGLASSSLRDQFRRDISALDIVMTARFAALETWWHTYTDADRAAALACLRRVGAARLAERTFATLSSGEQQRVQLARTLMGSPELLLLDEPTAGLDLAGREQLVSSLESLAADPQTPATVLVTHHTDEIPPSFTHGLLLRDGVPLACGPLADVLTAESLSECFAHRLRLERRDGRWLSWAVQQEPEPNGNAVARAARERSQQERETAAAATGEGASPHGL